MNCLYLLGLFILGILFQGFTYAEVNSCYDPNQKVIPTGDFEAINCALEVNQGLPSSEHCPKEKAQELTSITESDFDHLVLQLSERFLLSEDTKAQEHLRESIVKFGKDAKPALEFLLARNKNKQPRQGLIEDLLKEVENSSSNSLAMGFQIQADVEREDCIRNPDTRTQINNIAQMYRGALNRLQHPVSGNFLSRRDVASLRQNDQSIVKRCCSRVSLFDRRENKDS